MIAFVAQIIGNRLMNETEIRVHPDKQGTKEIAEDPRGHYPLDLQERQGRFRARRSAQVPGHRRTGRLHVSRSNTRLTTCFEQEIKLLQPPSPIPIPPFSIHSGVEPSGEDCQWAFVGDDIPQQEFKHALAVGCRRVVHGRAAAGTRAASGFSRRHRADRQLLADGHGRASRRLRSISTAPFTT
jgi:hypothetical protein